MSWTFVLVTPDAVLGGYLDFVLERVSAAGLRVRACRVLALDYRMLGRMYAHRDDPPPYRPNRVSLPPFVMTPLYALAPAALVVLDGDCATMLACKGKTRPEEAGAGSIRHAGENYVFNLVHCPDDPESAAIELSYLVGAADAAGMPRVTGALAPLVGARQLAACLPAFGGWAALSFPAVANRLRSRVVQQRAIAVQDDAAAVLRLQLVQAALDAEREALAAAASPVERLALAQATDAQVRVPLAEAAGASLAPGLAALGALYDIDGPRAPDAVKDLAAAGIYVAESEKVALDAHAYTYWR